MSVFESAYLDGLSSIKNLKMSFYRDCDCDPDPDRDHDCDRDRDHDRDRDRELASVCE